MTLTDDEMVLLYRLLGHHTTGFDATDKLFNRIADKIESRFSSGVLDKPLNLEVATKHIYPGRTILTVKDE